MTNKTQNKHQEHISKSENHNSQERAKADKQEPELTRVIQKQQGRAWNNQGK